MISSGGNAPDFDSNEQVFTDVLTALHYGREAPDTPEHVSALALLREKGFVSQTASGLRPSVFVAGPADACWLAVSDRLVDRCADLIISRVPQVQSALVGIANFAELPFDRVSFFVLSDVLLDSWQIDAVERDVVGAERPQRGGGRYYYAVMARSRESALEAFGIYGNNLSAYEGVLIGVYGNARVSAQSIVSLGRAELQWRFGLSDAEAARGPAPLALRLAAAARGGPPVSPEVAAGFRTLDLVDDAGRPSIPVLSEADVEALDAVAAIIRADYVDLLNRDRDLVRALYHRSPYVGETTFEEYYMWWYHMFYTAVTDRLIALGHARAPQSGVTTYFIV